MAPAYLKASSDIPKGRVGRAISECEGKTGFASPTLANKVAARTPYARLQVYRCKSCGLWHMGGTIGGRYEHLSRP